MKRLQKPPVGKTREKKQEPLAEGLQVSVPVGPKGRRLWSRMSDEEIVEYVRKVMEENEITGRSELQKADSGLYEVLRKRGLLDKVGFVEKRRKGRTWKDMSDEEVVEVVRKFVKENKITKRHVLEKADSGLYHVLRIRGLLDEIGFEERKRSWKSMSDEEVVELAKKLMEENGVSGKGELSEIDSGLYTILYNRGLLGEVGFEEKLRSWKEMSDTDVVELAKKIMEEKEITGRSELEKADSGLYVILRVRGLIEEVGVVEKRRKGRAWSKMSDEEVVEFAQEFIKEKGITEKNELRKAHTAVYRVLRRRGLLDRAFAQIEEQRTDQAREDVIDALTKFANEKPEVEVA